MTDIEALIRKLETSDYHDGDGHDCERCEIVDALRDQADEIERLTAALLRIQIAPDDALEIATQELSYTPAGTSVWEPWVR